MWFAEDLAVNARTTEAPAPGVPLATRRKAENGGLPARFEMRVEKYLLKSSSAA